MIFIYCMYEIILLVAVLKTVKLVYIFSTFYPTVNFILLILSLRWKLLLSVFMCKINSVSLFNYFSLEVYHQYNIFCYAFSIYCYLSSFPANYSDIKRLINNRCLQITPKLNFQRFNRLKQLINLMLIEKLHLQGTFEKTIQNHWLCNGQEESMQLFVILHIKFVVKNLAFKMVL